MGLLNFLPEDETKKQAARQGLLSLGAAMLQGRGNFGNMLGQGLAAGAQGYQGSLQDQQRAQMMQMQGDRWKLENEQTRAAIAEPGEIARIVGGGQAPMAPQSQAMPQGGAMPMSELPRAGGAVQAPQSQVPRSYSADEYRAIGDRLSATGRMAAAKPYYEQAEKMKPKLKEQKELTRDGKRVMVNVFEDARTEELEGFSPAAEKLTFQNTGGAVVGLDPFTGMAKNTIQTTQTPDSVASNARMRAEGAANRAQSASQFNQRLSVDKGEMGPSGVKGGKAPAGYRWTASGELEAIPGGPAGKTAAATEGERKAATLLKRMEFSEGQLESALKDDSGAAKPGLVAQGLRGAGLETAANTLTGSARQRVDSAQLDILDAALTLGTGAAYTREQLEGYRKSYFPQIGDSDAAVADKRARLGNVIEAAKIAAGRAAPGGDKSQSRAPAAGTVKNGYVFKGGNPADKANWVKQ